ncbi:MAG: alpha/beta hydrolase [Chloroflexi bacterium]|nr:alpha/beta hydrolase [Chloroflexota bacterium]
MAWADINGIRMYYESNGEGEAVIFAHGAGGNHLSWWQQAPHFRDRYRCVTFDHRGFGRSADIENGPGGRAYPEDLRALMDTLGIERAFLVAQSMGGVTCMGFTVAYPERVRGLVMADTTGTMTDDELTTRRNAFRDSQPAPFTLIGRAYNPDLKTTRSHMAFLYDSIMALNPPRSQPSAGAAPERDDHHVATTAKLAGITVPTLFICGEQDAIVPPDIIQYAATLIPGARYVEVPNAGHSVYFEEPDAFNQTLDEFFSSIEQAERNQARPTAGTPA